jgi:hypothetical protein
VSHVSDALLRLARAILTSTTVPVPVAVRTAALLGRMALERDVAARLAVALPGAEAGSMRAQLLCLRSLEAQLGEDAAHLHGALSHACHHHPYELGPTADDTAAMLDAVDRLTSSTRVPAGTAPPGATGPGATGPGATGPGAADSGLRTDGPGARP